MILHKHLILIFGLLLFDEGKVGLEHGWQIENTKLDS